MKRAILFLLFSFVCIAAFPHSVTEENGNYHITHSWKYKNDSWSCNLYVSRDLYEHYRLQCIHKSDNFAGFTLSDYDRECLRDLVKNFREAGQKSGYSDYDNVYNVVAFVQSLDYVTDLKSKGEKEYVRYPVETLVDGVGDCEDTSILMAAILREMGYGVVLLSLPNHLALGVKGDNTIEGSYYLYDNERYYYLETTDKGWKLGDVPKRYANSTAKVLPLVYAPKVVLRSYELHSVDYDEHSVVFKIDCKVDNEGPGTASGLFLHVIAYRKGWQNDVLAEQFFDLESLSESQKGEFECFIRVPREDNVIFDLVLSGNGFESNRLQSKLLDLR
ncbi:MAG: hypothetical protein MJZ97_01195 [Bacteroidales bacterium]|nr:hypothetical protein [Bacteroidales bacterium]